MIKSIEWCGDSVKFIDQTKLPTDEIYLETSDYNVIADAIRKLKIRGAPLIGIAAAYGVALSAIHSHAEKFDSFANDVLEAIEKLKATRPTAVNLFWALERMKKIVVNSNDVHNLKRLLIAEALQIHKEDEEMCRKIGENGAKLIPANAVIITHCNTGALATGGEGTAQSVITTAHRQGKNIKVYADETRPLLQGARLTAWELMKNGVDVTLITDNTAAFLMKKRKIDLVITGADRIAVNGDSANKIGTYNLAVIARHHNIPFYIAAPTSTIDASILTGDKIPIEERHANEVTEISGQRIAPENVKVFSPAFDVTPSNLISAIITDRGVFKPPFDFSNLKNK